MLVCLLKMDLPLFAAGTQYSCFRTSRSDRFVHTAVAASFDCSHTEAAGGNVDASKRSSPWSSNLSCCLGADKFDP